MVGSVDFEDRLDVGGSPLQAIWLRLRHRMGLILAITLFMGGVLAVLGQLIPPVYKSSASVIIDSQTPRTINGLTPDQPFTDNTIGTEISILESRELFEKVVDQLNLIRDPEFNKSLKPSVFDDLKKRVSAEIKSRLSTYFPLPPAVVVNTQHYDTVEELRSKVKFAPVPLSRVIDIVASSNNPARSAQVANAIAALYIDHHRELGEQIALRADTFLSNQLLEMKKAALQASKDEEDYRIDNNLMLGGHTGGGKDTTLAQEAASDINTQLMQAQNRLSQLQAAQASAKSGNPELSAAVLASPTIARLREQESLLQAKRAELLAKWGAESQMLAPINGQLAGIQSTIRQEARRQVSSIDIDVKAAQDAIVRLKQEQTTTLTALAKGNIAQAHLDTLHTEALAAQSMYTTFLAKAKETAALRLFTDSTVRQVSVAAVPVYPSFPQNKIVVPGALGIALIAACGFVLLIDRRRDPLLRLEDAMDVPMLGAIPLRTKRSINNYQDAIERLLSLLVRDNDNMSRVVLVTSANPQEGKSTISHSLADAASARGIRALLLQADFRSVQLTPRGQRHDGPQIGFSDILRGDAKAIEAMQVSRTQEGGQLTVIPSGRVPLNPVRLLSSSAMKSTLLSLRKDFELIIIDGPPILAGGDCWMIGGNADLTLMLVKAGSTTRRDVNDAIADLQASNPTPTQLGLVFNMVTKDVRRKGYA